MNSKKFLPIVFVIAALFGMISILEGKDSKIPLSKAKVYFSQNTKGLVTLYSLNIKNGKVDLPYCGAPTEGLKTYSGEFYLSFEKSRLNLGKMEFVENTNHSGNLIVKQLDPNDPRRDFIIISQYGTCSWEFAGFYGYDLKNRSLIQYGFKWKGEKQISEIALSFVKGGFLEVLPNREFISRVYDNSIGKIRASQWRLNDKENIFEGIDYWIELKDGENKVYTLIDEMHIPDRLKNPIEYKIDDAEIKIFPLIMENNEFGYFEAYNKGEKIYASDKVYKISGLLVFKYNGDKYFIVSEDSGGAHCCRREYIFSLDNLRGLNLIKIFNLGNTCIRAGSFLEKDNKLYLAIQDDRFAYFHAAFADSYFFNRYFLIGSDKIIERNTDFKNELIAQAQKWENDLNEIISKDKPSDYGSWARLFIGKTVNYILAGEPENAYRNWEGLNRYYTLFYASNGLEEFMKEIMEKMQPLHRNLP